jgi:hypothetical protein
VARDDVLDLVAQLADRVNGHPEHVRDVLPQLVALLDEHHDPAVIAAIIDALGKAWEEEANLRALRFADHSDPAVRLAVAQAIPGAVESKAATEAVTDALIRLSRDDVDEVRDWATFGIGSILELDTSDVRDSLFARTTDRSQEVRDEALVGLAHRRDPRALPLVREQLANGNVGRLVFEAAQYLAQPSLLDALAGWVADNPDDEALLGAVRACDPAYQDARTERQSALLASVERLMTDQGRQCRPALYCKRSSTDVLLTVDVSSRVWFVDGLLERAGNDVDRAANLVALDIDRP